MSKKHPPYTLQDVAREAGILVLPPGGAWVCIKGCPVWPRGMRLIREHRRIGIQHLDILWGYRETLAEPATGSRFHLPPPRVSDPGEALALAAEDLQMFLDRDPCQARLQATLITVSYPHPEEVRFFNSEVAVFTTSLIQGLLQANWIETHIFGQTQMPVLEEAVRDVVDALQMDGMSKSEAWDQALTAGVVEPEQRFIPQWFYRPIGEFRDTFVEE